MTRMSFQSCFAILMELCDLLDKSVLCIVETCYLSVYNPLGLSLGGFTFPSHARSDFWHFRNVKGNQLQWIWQPGDRSPF